MANTKQDSKPVRLESSIVAFCESQKKTQGAVRMQLENALRKSPLFWQNYTAWAEKNNIEVTA